MAAYAYSCAGTLTQWESKDNPDDFPHHHELHERLRDEQRRVNALVDELAVYRDGTYWRRLLRALTSFRRTR